MLPGRTSWALAALLSATGLACGDTWSAPEPADAGTSGLTIALPNLDAGGDAAASAGKSTSDGGSVSDPGDFTTDASSDALADAGANSGDMDAAMPPGDGGAGDGGAASDDASASTDAAAADAAEDAGSTADAAPIVPAVIHYVSGVVVGTLAGSDVAGTSDGTGAAATFDNPTGMALDGSGNLIVTDYDGARVRLVTPAGVVKTIAAGAGFVNPFDAVVASDGTYYVGTDADSSGTKTATSGTIWRVAPLADGGVGTPVVVASAFGRPRGLAAIAAGNLFLDDRDRDVVGQLAPATGAFTPLAGASGVAGFDDATGVAARFDAPVGSVARADGGVLVADSQNNRIRLVSPSGAVSTFAGTGIPSLVDGPCASAGFQGPGDVAVDGAGNVYVSDIGNHVVRRIDVNCQVETLAGTGVLGFHDGLGNIAQFYGQEGIDVTPDGRTIYLTDGNGGDGSAYHRVRWIALP